MTNQAAITSRKVRNTALLAGIGLIFGAFAGFGLGRFFTHIKAAGIHLAWSDSGALLLAVFMLGSGVAIATLGSNRRIAGRMVDPGEPRPATPQQMRFYRMQAFVLVLAGILLALPVLGQWLPGAASMTVRAGIMVALVLLFALQTYGNIRLWRRADEFMRALIAETSIICFWLLQSALLFWAAGEKLGLLPAATLWDALVVVMAVYLLVGTVQSLRKGFT